MMRKLSQSETEMKLSYNSDDFRNLIKRSLIDYDNEMSKTT